MKVWRKWPTSSSQVFLWAGDEGTQSCPFSRELSSARSRARDMSCLARFLDLQFTTDGDSDPDTSITCGIGGFKTASEFAD